MSKPPTSVRCRRRRVHAGSAGLPVALAGLVAAAAPGPAWAQAPGTPAETRAVGSGPKTTGGMTSGPPAPPPAPVKVPTAAEKAEAGRLYGLGVASFKAEAYPQAAEHFAAAFALDPSPVLLYNLARAQELTGDVEAATRHYRDYLARYPQAEDRAAVEQKVRVYEAVLRKARQGRLTLEGAPEGARVYIDDVPVEAAPPDGWALDPGPRAVRVEPLDGAVWQGTVTVTTGQVAKARYVDASDLGGGDAKTPTGTILGWTGVASGAVLLGVGSLFFARAASAVDEYDALLKRLGAGEVLEPGARAREQAEAQDAIDFNGTMAYVMWGVGAAALTTGVVLLVLNRKAPGAEAGVEAGGAAGLRLVPTFTPDGPGGFGISGTF